MSDTGISCHLPAEYSAAGDPGNQFMGSPSGSADPLVALMNLTAVRTRMDSLQRFLADSLNRNTLLPKDQMDQVSSELVSAIHQVIVNGATLLASSQAPPIRPEVHDPPEPTAAAAAAAAADEESDREDERMDGDDVEIVELDAVELLAEHIHFCEICGKGFKRDANLRMHMRAHGNQFKTPEALSKPENPAAEGGGGRRRRFSCPYVGCNRNQRHRNFRPLKSVICVKNHFKRSHCPKMYSCTRCHKKSFSVMADLKSHLKHCGHSRWKCSCGTTFSRKDKLFGHMALFEGHMPAVNASADDDENPTPAVAEVVPAAMGGGDGSNEMENGWLFEGLLEGFGSIANQDMTIGASSSTADLNTDIMEFFNF